MYSKLFQAIDEDNTPEALKLIAQGENVNSGGIIGDATNKASNLFLAIHNNNAPIALELIKMGAHPNEGFSTSGHSLSNLYMAISNNQMPIVHALIEAKADLNTGESIDACSRLDLPSVSNLGEAIRTKNSAAAMALIEAGANVDFGEQNLPSAQSSNLYLAIDNDLIAIALELINKGADINQGAIWSNGRKSNLNLAIEKGFLPLASALIEKGADLTLHATQPGNSFSNLFLAIEGGHTEIALALINRETHNRFSDLSLSIAAGHTDISVELIHRETYKRRSIQPSILPNEIVDGHTDIVSILSEEYAFPHDDEINSNHLYTIPNLGEAIVNNNFDIAMELIRHGVNVNGYLTRQDGGTISNLFLAIDKGHIETALAIIEAGADLALGATKPDGTTISNLQYAIDKNHVDIAQKLICKGADLSFEIYKAGIKNPEIAKAIYKRLYQGDSFPSLSALSMFHLPEIANSETIPEAMIGQYQDYSKDIAFLKEYGERLLTEDDESLATSEKEVAAACGVPEKPLSMFFKPRSSEGDISGQHRTAGR
ncbi:MAG: ankyrin repeat domain-containing protein [Pseudomonadota bacterium]|nr:ankyrin repeat domain-containing protein [Pseudomonadota bacterium]